MSYFKFNCSAKILVFSLFITHFHGLIEWLRLEGTFGDHLVQPLSSGRATESWLPRTMSRHLWNIFKNRDSTTSWTTCTSAQLITLAVEKCFLMFRGNDRGFSLCPWRLVLSLGITEISLTPSALHPSLQRLVSLMRYPWAFSSPG